MRMQKRNPHLLNLIRKGPLAKKKHVSSLFILEKN